MKKIFVFVEIFCLFRHNIPRFFLVFRPFNKIIFIFYSVFMKVRRFYSVLYRKTFDFFYILKFIFIFLPEKYTKNTTPPPALLSANFLKNFSKFFKKLKRHAGAFSSRSTAAAFSWAQDFPTLPPNRNRARSFSNAALKEICRNKSMRIKIKNNGESLLRFLRRIPFYILICVDSVNQRIVLPTV